MFPPEAPLFLEQCIISNPLALRRLAGSKLKRQPLTPLPRVCKPADAPFSRRGAYHAAQERRQQP